MELQPKYEIVLNEAATEAKSALLDPAASPFKLVVDPVMRQRLRQALFDLIDHHDASLASYFTEGKLSLESYKEYIELFARSLRETMETREGVAYLLKATGLDIPMDEINLQPEWRWR
ncbi:hypothetical protein AYO41_05055 [Verrucomicrobia bacterium SCGC AG-212-E04]|nr:hypothetical protein AYO41_05055 [Verrucomicrobia bacterium SCGC AG-212-E04]